MPAAAPHLLHVLPSFGVAGIQVRLAQVINALRQHYRHTIIPLDGITTCIERVDPDNFVAALPFARGGAGPFGRICRIRRTIAEQAPDLLLTYNWGTIEWALANRHLPLSAHIHFEDGFGPEEVDAQLRRRVYVRRLALRSARKVVVPSHTLLQLALRDWRLDAQQVLHIPNGIDVDALKATATAAPLFDRRPGDIVVGTIAPLRPEKNIGLLIRAIARAGDERLRLVIAGDGKQRQDLEREARIYLGDRALFLGSVAQPARVLRQLDIFALSSDTEQMPMTILEAAAMGLPIAAVAVGDVPLMVSHENRPFVVAKSDETGLAAALQALSRDELLRRRLGTLNERHIRAEYPLDRMIATYESMLSSVMAPDGKNTGAKP